MYEDVCYGKPFLREVIVRVDFSTSIATIDNFVPPKVAGAVLKNFPLLEPKKTLEQRLQFGQAGVEATPTSEHTVWNYFGKDREKRMAITDRAVFASYSKYTTYEDLRSQFLAALNPLFAAYPEVTAARVGLRYINNLENGTGDPFTWAEYIDTRLLGLLTRFATPANVTRLFHIAEFRFDDVINVKFQFGLPNPDFPALMRKRHFVLDLDGYVQGSQDPNEVAANLDLAHARIQQLFEESITTRLREEMGVVRNAATEP